MLTFNLTHSILCGLSIIALLVLLPPQPWGYSPLGSFVALLCCYGLPGLWQCWMVAVPPLLVGSLGVQHRSSWTSAVTSPQAPSLGLDLLVSCVAPLCAQGLQMQVCCLYDSGGGGQSCVCKAPANRKPPAVAVICHGSTHRLLKKRVNTDGAIPWC